MSGIEATTSHDRFLEEFPVNEQELAQLLQHHRYFSNAGDDFIVADWFPSDKQYAQILQQIEGTLLPPKLCHRLLSQAISSAVVLGEEEDDGQRRFLEAMVTCLGRRGPRPVLHLLHSCCCADDSKLADASVLLNWVYRLAVAGYALQHQEQPQEDTQCVPPNEMIQSLLEKSQDEEKGISLSCWLDWTTRTVPRLYTILSTFWHLAVFFPRQPFRPFTFELPQCDKPSVFWNQPLDPVSFSLACLSSTLGGKWRRLYSSDCDGSSFLTFQQALLGYNGPTTLLIRTTVGDEFGYYSDCPWKFSRKWFGTNSDSFLFRLKPSLAIYCPTGNGKHYMYLNPSTKTRNSSDLCGLAIGGISSDCPRLHLTESMEQCRVSEIDTTYESGPLMSPSAGPFFDVDLIEVWTVVNDKSFDKHSKEGRDNLDVSSAYRQRAARVDRAEFLDDFANDTIPNNLYQHRTHARGRHDFEVDDDHGGYTTH